MTQDTAADEKQAEADQGPVDPKQVPWWTSSRLALACVGFLGFVNLYALRVNMSVAIVCMTKEINPLGNQSALASTHYSNGYTNGNHTDEGTKDAKCAYASGNNNKTSSGEDDGEFNWDKETQGIILGAFFWGYLVTQVPGGWMAERFGGKRVFGFCMLMTAVATMFTPVGSRGSPYLLMVLQFIKGLGEGVVFPSMHAIWAKWAPPLERSKLIGFTYAGAQIGNVLTLPISGLLCEYGFDGGWASIFYILGTFGLLWFGLWMFIASDTPNQHPRITNIERRYIETTIGGCHIKKEARRRELGTPWLAFAKSKAVWAIIVAHTCSNWGTYTLLTNIPAYMKEVLKFDIKANGFFSAIPYLFFWLFINLAGFTADTLRARGWRTVLVRKIMLALGTILPGILLIATGYVTCENPYVAVGVLALAVGFSGFQYAGVMVNHVDIAPPFAGILFGISNTCATFPGIMAPYAIGRITADQTQASWQIVFYISAVIYVIGTVFFTIFAEGEIQPWVRPYMFDEEVPVPLTTTPSEEKDKSAPLLLTAEA